MTFAEDVRRGLCASEKSLPPKYLYDALGSLLFEAICLLPEYYLARAESEILRGSAHEMVARIAGPLELIELGSGSAAKTRHIIEALLARQGVLHYRPIDISTSALNASAEALSKSYPGLTVEHINAEYTEGLARLSRNGRTRTLALFLGSNVGNFDSDDAVAVLRAIRAALLPGDALLMGADLRKTRATLEAAYDDALGVTAAFNLNLLVRINRELGGRFALKRFEHAAVYDDSLHRIEMRIRSLDDQEVDIDDLGLRVSFKRGETIFTESSYKYDLAQIEALAGAAGFELVRTWTDSQRRFSSNLLVCR